MQDDTDRRLLRLLQEAPDLSTAELAERAGLTAMRCARRLARLQDAGVLRGSRAVIDWKALGFEVAVSLRVTLDKTQPRAFDEFLARAREVAEVIEIQTFLGRVDVRLQLVARDLDHYRVVYRERILALPHIADIESLMTVSVVKSDEKLPL
ncbi:Lrp/AsnC family transcriptional regulator [Limimaricola soesokkakensis]|uniref:Leucine-responsive regulatory protein n=1 Tax=Limimaricola soesokkakensis TaxID=1343159 RepID=A0A1X6YAN1_9RHOB|nr:Lrp/AsnC family transcriptional regulator [Limimaricola soesokkakensis]PSK87142.1 Lrp/AsnC family transcriptional regulator [Limimaricola soesokkakensis]SLN15663.1 Leucine-responsive regulatory protein [Limimaricola soesokkakensis]